MSTLREVVVNWEDQSRSRKMKQTQKKNNHDILLQKTLLFFPKSFSCLTSLYFPHFSLESCQFMSKKKKLWRKNHETTREDNKSTKGPNQMHAIQIVCPYFFFHYLPLAPSTFSHKRLSMPKCILAPCYVMHVLGLQWTLGVIIICILYMEMKEVLMIKGLNRTIVSICLQ